MQRIKKGDTVEVIAGKDLGDRGEVVTVILRENRVVVDGVNVMKKHQKAQQAGRQQVQSQILEFNGPIHLSNVMLVCPSCEKATRVGYRFKEDGTKTRFCKKCNSDIK
ncbi:MAG: 50S ribosomal protein L24 [Anaerolineae bacterium]|jgi:large subunit ribosomal protein L24|nr:50S ribosomal protein L24 [Anaerolineae bacterium]